MDISQYDYLWTNEKYDYVLVKDSTGYSIVGRTTNSFLLIENEKIAKEVVEKMLDKGVPVFESALQLRNNCPPINIVGQPFQAEDFPVKRYKVFIEWSKDVPLAVQVKEFKEAFPIVKKQSNQVLLENAKKYKRWQFDLLYLDESQKAEIMEHAKTYNLHIVFELDELREYF